jgi:hypothetical protein
MFLIRNIYKHTSTQYINKNRLSTTVKKIFYETQKSMEAGDMEKLSRLLTLTFLNKYKKRRNQLFLSKGKIHIENTELQKITNLKFSKKDFSVDILFTAVTHTKHDKNTVYWRTRHNYAVLFPNKEIGEDTTYKQSFKQRWFFTYESEILKVQKIKGIYLKNITIT